MGRNVARHEPTVVTIDDPGVARLYQGACQSCNFLAPRRRRTIGRALDDAQQHTDAFGQPRDFQVTLVLRVTGRSQHRALVDLRKQLIQIATTRHGMLERAVKERGAATMTLED
jgi:hypothetical protein